MSNSINLNLPYLLSNQAQKHVTHNEALKMLDVLVQLSVVDNTLSTPPQSPGEGDSYTIASSPTGVWAGKENQVTIWHDGAWSFYSPNKGWITWVESNNTLQAYNGTDWVDISGVLSASTAPILGINATADTINRLSVNSAAILFNKEVDDVQVKLNKQASTDTASFLFQTNFSGRAEIGATGDDDFHFKVSSDGTTWNEGIIIDSDTGEVSFPNTTLAASSSSGSIDDLVARIFSRVSPTQWGFCHVVSEAYTDIAKTTKAIAVDDVVAVIEDKSPNNINLVAGGTSTASKIKLRLDPLTVGVDESHPTTHFLKVTVPTGGFKGKLIMAYRSGIFSSDVDVPAGDWEIWSGHGIAVASGLIGAFAAENISKSEIEAVSDAFHALGAGSKPLITANNWFLNADSYYTIADLTGFDFSNTVNISNLFKSSAFKKIILNGNDFQKVTNMHYMFRDCVSTLLIKAIGWDTSSATAMSNIFYNCSSLVFLDVSTWNLSKAISVQYMFYGCSSLKSIDVSSWDLSSATAMSNLFNGCSSLKSIDVSSWDVSSAESLSGLFKGCSSLKSIDVSSWDLSSATAMSNLFNGCSSLKSIDVSSWDLSSSPSMHYMFYGCSSLKSIDVGGGFDNTSCLNFTNAFTNCALDEQSVDDILVSIENAGTSNGTLNINGGTNSAPSSVGMTAKTALQGRGWTVTTQ